MLQEDPAFFLFKFLLTFWCLFGSLCIFSFWICIPFISLSYLTVLARTSVRCWKGVVRGDIFALFLILVGKLWVCHHYVVFLKIFFITLRKFPSSLTLLRVFLKSQMGVWFCQVLFASVDNDVMDYIDFLNVEIVLHTWDKSRLVVIHNAFYTLFDSMC